MIKVFSVKDTASETFMRPFFLHSDRDAVRAFTESCRKEQAFQDWPHDFVLYEVGAWDEQEGMLIGCEPKRLISAAGAIKAFKAMHEQLDNDSIEEQK